MHRFASRYAWRHRRSRGQALVELALIVPMLLLLLLATVDLGRLFYSQITITNSAREGALEASVHPTSYVAGTCDATTSTVVCAAMNETRNSFVTVAASDVTLTCTGGCAKTYGKEAAVTVTGHFSLLTPLMAAFTGGSNITLASTAKAQVIIVPTVVAASPTPTPAATPTPNPVPTPTPAATPTPTPTPSCPPPYAAFGYSQLNKNKPVVFTSSSTPTSGLCSIISWRWVFGDTGISEGNLPTVTHTYAVKGRTYTVTLTVTNTAGMTTTTVLTLTTKS